MKRKILKLVLVSVFIIMLLIVFSVRVQDYMILSKATRATKEVKNNINELQIRVIEKYKNGEEKILETYKKDGVYVLRKIDNTNAPSNSLIWETENEEEICNNYYEYEFEYQGKVVKGLNSIYNHDNTDTLNRKLALGNLLLMFDSETFFDLKDVLLIPKVKEGKYDETPCFIIESETRKWFIDSKTMRTIAIEDQVHEEASVPYLYIIEYDIKEPEGIYDRPKAEYYDKVDFIETNYIEKNSNNEVEQPISNTKLKAGEELIEKVTIAEGEELNFLNITGNSFGLQGFNIQTYETYNKFREKYSNLRELSKEDFINYYVGIVYKEGYELNCIQQIPSEESKSINYVFNSKESETDSFVLIVTPRISNSLRSNFIESTEKLKISEEVAKEIIASEINLLISDLILDKDGYVNINYSEITIMDNTTFVNLDYIKTPVKGKTPITWKLTIVDADNRRIDAYVDALSGELIGAKNQ